MLLAQQLNKYGAKSNEALTAKNFNASQNDKTQQFNAGTERVNIQQQNMADDVNARNSGAFESQKLALQTALAKSLEGHGTENLNKERIKELFDYNFMGQFLKNKK